LEVNARGYPTGRMPEIFDNLFEGAPATPNVSLHVVDAVTLQLSWEPPFTWPQYEIVRYTVIMENRSNGDVLPPVVLNPSDTTFITTTSAPVQSCAELRFNVTAHSALGASTPAVVAGGFPIGEEWTGSPCVLIQNCHDH